MKPHIQRDITGPKGFTLLEILIAISIFAMVIAMVLATYRGSLHVFAETESRAEIYHMAQVTFERILEDLESVYIPQVHGDPESEDEESPAFAGEDNDIQGMSADTLRFSSRAHLVIGQQDLPCGTAVIEYYLEESEQGDSLILYRNDTPHFEEPPEDGKAGLPLCEGLASLDFTYYDVEGEEYENWASPPEKGMPPVVSVSLEFVNPLDPEAPFRFVTSVALPMSEV